MELLCFPNATSPQPLNFLCESGSSTKTPKLSFKVEEPELRQSPHSVLSLRRILLSAETTQQAILASETDPALQPSIPLVAQHSSSGTKQLPEVARTAQCRCRRGWAERAQLIAEVTFWGMEGRGSNHTQTVEEHTEKPGGGGESEAGQGGVRRGPGGCARAGGGAAAAAAAALSGCAAAAPGGRAETCRRRGSAGRTGRGAGWR